MSDSWVNDRLESQVGEDKAREIQKAMSKGNVDKVISRIDEKGNVITNKLRQENLLVIGHNKKQIRKQYEIA